MQQETLRYEADGLSMKGELFVGPGSGKRAGVLVFPEAFGLNDHALTRAERLADLGYVAMACDLHGEGKVIEDLGAAIAMLDGLYADPRKTRARATGALGVLSAHPTVDAARIGAIGFCFGGTMALELARSGADIKVVVGFHSGLGSVAPKTDAMAIRGRILVCIGGDDPFIDLAQRVAFEVEMRDAGVDWQLNVYGRTVHSFTNPNAANVHRPEAIRYNPLVDQRSWRAMHDAFLETLG
jgi:dienelactone hydrolase